VEWTSFATFLNLLAQLADTLPTLKEEPLLLFAVVVQAIGENQESRSPKPNKDSKPLGIRPLSFRHHIARSWCTKLSPRGKPDHDRGDDGKKTEGET